MEMPGIKPPKRNDRQRRLWSLAGAADKPGNGLGFGNNTDVTMNRLKLSIATTDYDHFRDFRLGTVEAQGIEETWSMLGHHEIFARFTFNREWDVAELSFAKFCAQVTRKDSGIVGLPVVCSRLFRFSSFYVNKKSKIRTAKDLKGKKVGSPEWAHTAAVYMRGWLGDECGVALKDVHWVQAGLNQPGRAEKVELSIPKGVKLTRVEDKSLSDMLAKGEIDCALVARPPDCFMKGHPDVERLFPNYLEMEEKYYARSKVWPIMHVIAIKKAILDRDPWVAGSLYNAFMESKERSVRRLTDVTVSRYPLPWVSTYARTKRDEFDGDPFPYGIDENRPTLEQFMRYTHEQGIAHRHAKVDDIFPKGMMVEHLT
jgi:4,5-dihydroxyphthalate decarboxylase